MNDEKKSLFERVKPFLFYILLAIILPGVFGLIALGAGSLFNSKLDDSECITVVGQDSVITLLEKRTWTISKDDEEDYYWACPFKP